jgi:hypothetical protein
MQKLDHTYLLCGYQSPFLNTGPIKEYIIFNIKASSLLL